MNSSQAQVDSSSVSEQLKAEIAARKHSSESKASSQATHPANLPASRATTTTTTNSSNSSAGLLTHPIDSHATTLDVARVQARSTAGQSDPFMPLSPLRTEAKTTVVTSHAENNMIPPPPPTVHNPFGDSGAGQLNSGLNIGELPMPPENAGVSAKLQLVAIVGDRAIFSVKDSLVRRRNHWPKTLTLGIGQIFDGMKLTAINDESAVIEEDGQTIVKALPVIK